jgi:aspartate kinase
MALMVLKFGGTSVGSLEKIKEVAAIIQAVYDAGYKVVVVVSAMAGETDRLISLANNLVSMPDPRETDVLLATGEQVSIALLSMVLIGNGYPARSYAGYQVKINTDNVHTKARITSIDNDNILPDLDRGIIAVVAGFQGIDAYGNITTLGRGGSDTTAVALAAALEAEECRIYTDVKGVYTADPRVVPNAKLLKQIAFKEMLELSSLGAVVLQTIAMEIASQHKVPLRILSTFDKGMGTLISYEDKPMHVKTISGITFTKNESRVIIRGIFNAAEFISLILGSLSDANIELDMLVHNLLFDGTTDFTFTVKRSDLAKTVKVVESVLERFDNLKFITLEKIGKISLVGIGMHSHADITSKIFKVLTEKGVDIQLIFTSEIKVSVLMDEKYVESSVKALHKAFQLEEDTAIEKEATNSVEELINIS